MLQGSLQARPARWGSSQWRRRAQSSVLPHVGLAAVRGPEQRADIYGRAARGGPNNIYCVRCIRATSGAALGLQRGGAACGVRPWGAECSVRAWPGPLQGKRGAWHCRKALCWCPRPRPGSTRRSLSGLLLVSSTKLLPGRK